MFEIIDEILMISSIMLLFFISTILEQILKILNEIKRILMESKNKKISKL